LWIGVFMVINLRGFGEVFSPISVEIIPIPHEIFSIKQDLC
jgi:hypothetical protein